jgi:hypothetical protein
MTTAMKARQSISKMSRKWFEMAQSLLDEGDEIRKSYDGKIDGKYGWLIISDKKVMFLNESGFISKSYSVVFEILRENIKDITQKGAYELIITDVSGNTSRFQTLEIHADLILEGLADSMVPNLGAM